jgi:hypothetical protein
MASVYVKDYPKETTKLVMKGKQMIACTMIIFDVTDKSDKEEYTRQIK